jgi:hypothetical protein
VTHDELLAKIKTGNEFAGIKYAPDSHTFALRAVVELHRPIKRPKWLPIEFQGYSCNLCPGSYPCPTIKAIEKELG